MSANADATDSTIPKDRSLRPAIVLQPGTGLSDGEATPFLLLEGFCAQVTHLDGKRHIIGLHVAGDLMNLEALFGATTNYQLVALGQAKITRVEIRAQNSPPENDCKFPTAFLAHSLRAEALARAWSFRLAALNAPRRIAHLLTELRYRVHSSSAEPRVLRTPFTQTDIGDMCGISAIHANRAFASIRDQGLGEMRRGDFYPADWSALETYAHFDASYVSRAAGGVMPMSQVPDTISLASISGPSQSHLQGTSRSSLY